MYTLPHAVRLKEHLLERWESADRDPQLIDDGALNVVVVGGGPTGVETAGAIAELYRAAFAKDYPGVAQEQARVILVEAGPELFAMFKPKLRTYATNALTERTVEVMTGALVDSVSPTRVKLKSGDYRLYSRKVDPKTGRRRNLGTFSSRAAAEKHERDVQYFKRH